MAQVSELPEDFCRNFLYRNDLKKTFESFQQEWFAQTALGSIKAVGQAETPEIYRINQELSDELTSLREEISKLRTTSAIAESNSEKCRRERDYHRLQHRRILHEKEELALDLKKVVARCKELEPHVAVLEGKYENMLRQNMLTSIDRDRAKFQLSTLQSPAALSSSLKSATSSSATAIKRPLMAPGKTAPLEREATMPIDHPPTAQATQPLPAYTPWTAARMLRLSPGLAIKAHSAAVSCVAAHPTRDQLASGSDDGTIRLWAGVTGDSEGVLEGHRGWIAACEFSSDGATLASASGDASVKLWDTTKQECLGTLSEHSHPVWSISYHHTSLFLASGSMDSTIKIWDIAVGRSKLTMRGHHDSVNSVQFQYLGNSLLSASADRTVQLWDARSGLMTKTLRGHGSAVNSAVYNRTGDYIASADADGLVLVWDTRQLHPLWSNHDYSSVAANRCAFDHGGAVLAIARDNGAVSMLNAITGDQLDELHGHNESVLGVAFAASGRYFACSGSDGTVRLWS